MHLIRPVEFGLAAFVLDRISAFAIGICAKLDEVGDTGEVQPTAGKRQRHDTAQAPTPAVGRFVSYLMQNAPLRGEAVLFPQPLDMDQRRLPHAINRMLQGGERNRIIQFRHRRLPITGCR